MKHDIKYTNHNDSNRIFAEAKYPELKNYLISKLKRLGKVYLFQQISVMLKLDSRQVEDISRNKVVELIDNFVECAVNGYTYEQSGVMAQIARKNLQ